MRKRFEDVLDIINGKNQKKVEHPNGIYPIYGSGGVMGYADDYLCEANTVVIGRKGSINNPIYVEEPFWNVDTAFGLTARKDMLLPRYLYFFCVHYDFCKLNTTVTIPSLTKANLLKIEMDVPDIDEQKKIVDKLDSVVKLIRFQKEQIKQLDTLIKARFVEMFGDPISNPMGWDKKPLANECDIITGNTPSRKVPEYYGDYIEWIKSDNINTPNAILTKAEEYLSEEGLKVARSVDAGAILMTCIAGSIGCIGNVAIANRTVSFNQQINGIIPKRNNTWFMYVLFELSKGGIQSAINMALKGILSKGQLAEMEFIFPPVKFQNEFGDFVERIDKLKVEEQRKLEKTQILFDSLMQQYFG